MQLVDDLFLGTKGCVVRIRKRDGREVWRTKLKGRDLVVVAVEPDGKVASSRDGSIKRLQVLPGARKVVAGAVKGFRPRDDAGWSPEERTERCGRVA